MKLGQKLLENERIFNNINQKIMSQAEEILPTDIPPDLLMHLYCECGDEDCKEMIEITLEDFKKQHKDKLTFMVKPNHYFPRFERVLKRYMNHWLVQKRSERLH